MTEQAHTHTPRRIDIPGTFNFRDLGGWSTQNGDVITGLLFRSDGLARLTSESHDMLRTLRIGTVIDLRETRETTVAPSALDGLDLERVHMPLFGDRYYPVDLDRPDRIVLAESTLPNIYSAMIEHCGPNLAATVSRIAGAQAPVVYHCSAGKDRTGVISAFVLTLLGVPRADVLADYTATESFLGEEFVQALSSSFAHAGIVANLSATATQAPIEYLDRILHRVDRDHGSVAEYLVSHGLAPAEVEALRSSYLTRS